MSRRSSPKPPQKKPGCVSGRSSSDCSSRSNFYTQEDTDSSACTSSRSASCRSCSCQSSCHETNQPVLHNPDRLPRILLSSLSYNKGDHQKSQSRQEQREESPVSGKKERFNSERSPKVKESTIELNDSSRRLLCSYIYRDIIGCDFSFVGPFGQNYVTYLDYVASGRPLKCIEQYIRLFVMPTYSNTHTEVNFISQQTSKFRDEARDIIRECVHATDDDAIIFTGSGATAAINKLIHAMNIRTQAKHLSPIVFVGPYEHHSNILPWREIATKVITIRQTENGLTDLENLTQLLEMHTKCSCKTRHLLIGSFSAASNVTGILTDVNSVSSLMHRYGGYAFFDYACAAPYTDIDMNPPDPHAFKDAVFISPHKFIGGPQTPGILVAKRWVFRNLVPHGVGGGTVVFVRRTAHHYTENVEHREEGGTPGIIESIRAGLVFKLKATFTPKFIMSREQELLSLAKASWGPLPNLLIMGNLNVDRLPIFPMLFFNPQTGRLVHHDFIAKVLNDVFGIQVRSGCACAGPYGMDLLGMNEKIGEVYEKLITVKAETKDTGEVSHVRTKNMLFKPGFVRLNFPYFMPKDCLNFVLKAIQLTSEKAWLLLPMYDFDRDTGRWWYKLERETTSERSLGDVSWGGGKFNLKQSAGVKSLRSHQTNLDSDEATMFQSAQSSTSGPSHYDDILRRAEQIFAEAETPDQSDTTRRLQVSAEEEYLRWFMLPSEAVDILNNRQVKYVAPSDLPFLPGALREKLHLSAWTSRKRAAAGCKKSC